MKHLIHQLLELGQRRLGIDTNYLARSGWWTLLSYSGAGARGFLLSLLFARLLTKEMYGQYNLLLAFVGIAEIFSVPGMNVASIKAAAEEKYATFRTMVQTALRFSLLATLLLLMIGLWYLYQGETVGWGLIIASLLVPLYNVAGYYGNFYTGRGQFGHLARVDILFQLISLVVLSVTVIVLPQPPLLVALLMLSTIIVKGAATWRILENQNDEEVDLESLRYGKYLSFIYVSGLTATYADKLLIGTIISPTQLAAYALAILFPEFIRGFFNAFNQIAFSRAAQLLPDRNTRQLLLRLIGLYGLIMIAVVGAYILVAPLLFSIFYPTYPESIPLTQVFALSILYMPFLLIMIFFQAKGMLREIYAISIGRDIVLVLLLFGLVPRFGSFGAVYAYLGTALFIIAATLFCFWRVTARAFGTKKETDRPALSSRAPT